jgi:hypothetical protein
MKPTALLLALVPIALPVSAQSAPPAVNYGTGGGQLVAPVNVNATQQNTIYPVQVPQPPLPAPAGYRCSISVYGQQTTGQASFGGLYTVGTGLTCPL